MKLKDKWKLWEGGSSSHFCHECCCTGPKEGELLRGGSCSNDLISSTRAWTSFVEASRTCCQQGAVVRRRRSRRGENWEDACSTGIGRCFTGSRFGRHSPGVEGSCQAPTGASNPISSTFVQKLGRSSVSIFHGISVRRDAEPQGVLLGASCGEGVACPLPSCSPGGHSFGEVDRTSEGKRWVRGIVAGDIVRRWWRGPCPNSSWSRCRPRQHHSSMRCQPRVECIDHALQGLTELNPRATVMSIDGISGLTWGHVAGTCRRGRRKPGFAVCLNVLWCTVSQYLWEDTIKQGEGGEQGYATMPLFSLGQHSALFEGAGTIARGKSLAGILGRYLHSHHARARCTGSWKRVFGPSREFASTRENQDLECSRREARMWWVGEDRSSCRSDGSGVAGVWRVSIVSTWHQDIGNPFGSPGFRDSAVGDGHGRTPDVVVPHSICSGCAGSVVASGPLCGRSCKLRGQSESGGTRVCRTCLSEARCWVVAVSVKWRRGKKREILGSPPWGAPPFGPDFSGFGPHHFGSHTHTPDPELDWPNLDWPKLVKSGWPKRDWPKSVPSFFYETRKEDWSKKTKQKSVKKRWKIQ